MNKGLFFVVLFAVMAAVLPAPAQQGDGSRIALIIGNANYPDAEAPLKQPVLDARAVADEFRRNGFEVDVGENLTKEATQRAVERFYGRIKNGSSAVFFFSGYGIQTGRQTYLIPVNAQIWTEGEVRRDGLSVDTVLAEMNARGAAVKLAILEASRRNPFERRFRGLSAGLAPVTAPRGTLVTSAAAPGTVVNESSDGNSLFVRELLKEMRSPNLTVEEIVNRTRIGVSRASKGEQVPWISSSLVEDFYLGKSSRPEPARPEPSRPSVADDPPPRPAPSQRVEPAPRDPDADVRRDYDFAERVGTRKSLEDFLAKHKTGTYADRARDKLARLDPPSAPVRPEPRVEPRVEPRPEPRVEPRPEPRVEPKPEPSRPEPKPSTAGDPLIKELALAIQKNPNDPDGYFKRGLAYAEKRDYPQAVKDFDQVIRLSPKDAEAFNNRCWTRAMVGDLQMALRDCNESLRLRPNFVDALDSRGLVNLKIGLPNSAIADYNAALRINPKHASALFGRGKAKLKNGDTAGGNADLAAAKAINPEIADDFVSYGIK
jgi:Caspase domain/Tetratricopeptide repeat